MGNAEGIEEPPGSSNKPKSGKGRKGTVHWVPDEEAVECGICKAKFTVTNRRVRTKYN